MTRAPLETEIKLAVPDVLTARRLLRAAGFRVSRARAFESNTVFDTPERSLRKSARLLRVRTAGRVHTVTFKGPPLPGGPHKTREEVETTVADPGAMARIAEALGFAPLWRYDKYRTEFRLARGAGVAVLDETPVGIYLELEGPAAWIDRVARRLGFAPSDYITASYGSLYQAWCEARGIAAGNMVFTR